MERKFDGHCIESFCWVVDRTMEKHRLQNYEERTHAELVKDLNAAHDLRRRQKADCDRELRGMCKKLRWEKIKSRILAGLIVASLTSSLMALVKAAWVAQMVVR